MLSNRRFLCFLSITLVRVFMKAAPDPDAPTFFHSSLSCNQSMRSSARVSKRVNLTNLISKPCPNSRHLRLVQRKYCWLASPLP
ncbi:hypothetical protein EDD85DRAFT_121793 [Armillaria nabsnona]|nr:hypothetical protein EDD85DRAFT_121793 [Armillaria nabsnona]